MTNVIIYQYTLYNRRRRSWNLDWLPVRRDNNDFSWFSALLSYRRTHHTQRFENISLSPPTTTIDPYLRNYWGFTETGLKSSTENHTTVAVRTKSVLHGRPRHRRRRRRRRQRVLNMSVTVVYVCFGVFAATQCENVVVMATIQCNNNDGISFRSPSHAFLFVSAEGKISIRRGPPRPKRTAVNFTCYKSYECVHTREIPEKRQ